MIKSEAMAKVLDMHALAEGDTTMGEAAAAIEQAIKLRLKFGISDGELELAKAARDLNNEGMVNTLFFHSRVIAGHLANIEGEMQAVLDEMDRLPLADRLSYYCQFYRDMRARIDSRAVNARYGFRALALRRDDVVREYYRQELLAYYEQGFRDKVMAHEHARSYTSIHSDLDKATVERIVGISEKNLMQEAWQELQAERGD